jgi:hypothetical protein
MSMDLFSYDHEELARRIQTGLDRMTVNYLRAHGAHVHRDDLDFHGIEHVELDVEFDKHHLVLRQTGRLREPVSDSPEAAGTLGRAFPADTDLNSFESTFDGQPASAAPTGLIAQWLALLPPGERKEERPKPAVDASNPFLADVEERQKNEPINPFLSGAKRSSGEPNPFAPEDSDEKRRAAFNWLAGDEEH